MKILIDSTQKITVAINVAVLPFGELTAKDVYNYPQKPGEESPKPDYTFSQKTLVDSIIVTASD